MPPPKLSCPLTTTKRTLIAPIPSFPLITSNFQTATNTNNHRHHLLHSRCHLQLPTYTLFIMYHNASHTKQPSSLLVSHNDIFVSHNNIFTTLHFTSQAVPFSMPINLPHSNDSPKVLITLL